MNRESNTYLNTISGEILNAEEMYVFVNHEAKRQYEEYSGDLYCNLTIDEQQECILEQWIHQVDNDWTVV